MADRSPISLRQAIENQARRLGFDLFGVTTPETPSHFAIFQKWLDAGRHGEMDYLASERSLQRRADPRLILPECLSILVLGVPYPAPERSIPEADQEKAFPSGRIAAYAQGDDYHDVLPTRLARLAAFIEQAAGRHVPMRWYTDSGPLLERDLAQRAGLGWIGKNTCLINPEKGSFFLLAEVLLGLDLEPDPPFAFDRCGSCRRCLDACPTACIQPDRTIDARQCISYLTIELKGAIPQRLRPQLGEWIFGCDICQQVCPWNQRSAGQAGDPSFAPRPGLAQLSLLQEIRLTGSEFNQKFKGSPLKRAKRRGYLRNAAVALGCTGDERTVPALCEALVDPEPLVRMHAAWALGQVGGRQAEAGLNQESRMEVNADVLDEIRAALKRSRAEGLP
jgi:epoxyqueuosine reductase